MQTLTKAKISKEDFINYIHEENDLLELIQDDLSDSLRVTGRFSISVDEVVNDYCAYIPLHLFKNLDDIKKAYPKRVKEDSDIFAFPEQGEESFTLDVEWID